MQDGKTDPAGTLFSRAGRQVTGAERNNKCARQPDMKNRVAQFRAALRRKGGNFWGKPPERIGNVWVFCELMVKKHRNIIIAEYFMCEIHEIGCSASK